MYKYIKIWLPLAAFMWAGILSAAPQKQEIEIIKCDRNAESSFAIFVDENTYDHCREAILAYRDVLQEEGLGTYILSAAWQSPDQVKAQILKMASRKPSLEGVVFIGEVPIVKVGGAQHMTTAFKMNEKRFPKEESWVTTDRFYDDFDLSFDYVEQDTTDANIFYYRLNEQGAQHLASDIYSARMIVPEMMGDSYEILNQYLAEVVAAHRENNVLDVVSFYAGSGYNSDCLTLWRQKSLVWRESFPAAFEKASHNRFFNYRQGTDVKHKLFNEIQRTDVDYFQFSEHGAEDTQYITNTPIGTSLESDLQILKQILRHYYEDYKGTTDEEAFLQECEKEFGMPRTIFSDEDMKAQKIADSLEMAESNIVLSEIVPLKSAPRFVVFNACYNGSFHQKEGYVAGCHVFNGGRTVVAQGNTVNVLQDKWEDDLIGMLSVGVRVGVWQKEIPFLESHLIGDPTYRFTSHNADEEMMAKNLSYNKKPDYWQAQLQSSSPLMRAAAVKRLYAYYLDNNKDMQSFSDEVLKMLQDDSAWTVQREALQVLGKIDNDNRIKAVAIGMDKLYERVRREAAFLAGEIGDESMMKSLQYIVDSCDEVTRVQMAAESSMAVMQEGNKRYTQTVAGMMDTSLTDAKRIMEIRTLRNSHLHYAVDSFLTILNDTEESEELRVVLCEALGWFDRSVKRPEILAAVEKISKDKSQPEALRKEAIKTQKRLFMK